MGVEEMVFTDGSFCIVLLDVFPKDGFLFSTSPTVTGDSYVVYYNMGKEGEYVVAA